MKQWFDSVCYRIEHGTKITFSSGSSLAVMLFFIAAENLDVSEKKGILIKKNMKKNENFISMSVLFLCKFNFYFYEFWLKKIWKKNENFISMSE